MNRLSDPELWEYIRGDLPYFDLTTQLLALPPQRATLKVLTRDEVVAACTEEAVRIGELLGCEAQSSFASGSVAAPGSVLLELHGDHETLHSAWRLCQILLEYACGMATRARTMLAKAHAVNPHCELLVTRKSFPFAKRFSTRALMCGGAMPHRLGLSETVLVFEQHRALYKDTAAFEAALRELKQRCVEKKLTVESESLEDAKRMLALGADVIQMDKCGPDTLQELVAYKREHHPGATILAAGGINPANVADYAASGVEGVVTSSPYQAGMADLTARWETDGSD
ncbi:ModD protein [Sulfurimonas diazotrophicus]|uniref:Putative pyrophosphorylase ModD n=1 Tax=Sulfurimonas diazotrophicus TaxID=3131939 RepID=A0ABZ3H796_9BACT